MKKLLLITIIAGLLFSCSNPTETNQQIQQNGTKITTLVFSYTAYKRDGYVVLYTKQEPDTVIPAWLNANIYYERVDSIWDFRQSGDTWSAKANGGSDGYQYGSSHFHKFVKLWRE